MPRRNHRTGTTLGALVPGDRSKEYNLFNYILRLPGLPARVHSALSLLYGPRNTASLCPDPLWGERSPGTPRQRTGGSRPARAGLGALAEFPSRHTHLGSASFTDGGQRECCPQRQPKPLVQILPRATHQPGPRQFQCVESSPD